MNIIARRSFLKRTGSAAAGFFSSTFLFSTHLRSKTKSVSEKPNIILIMADDLGYGDIGCYGGTRIKTPNIDRLAKRGILFTDYHSNGSVCSPTRAALLTGRYQQRSNVEGVIYAKGPARETGLSLKEVTFAEELKKAGYLTAIFGKWHLGYNVEFNPAKQGFDEFRGYVSGNVDYISHVDGAGFKDWWKNCEKVPEDGYVTDLITKHGARFIEQNQNKPFCLYLPHESPHYPYQGRNDKADRKPGNPQPGKGSRKDQDAAYKEMVEVMDEGIGKIVDTVKRLGLERKTFIFFCSDNGATKLGSNGKLRGFKGQFFEGGHRVPAIACWPGRIAAGVTTDQTAMGMDLFPTMISVAGAKPPPGLKLDGIDLSPLLHKNKSLGERTLFWRYRGSKAVRKGPWKLLINRQRKRGKKKSERPANRETVHLFNLDKDLQERNNLVNQLPKKAKELKRILKLWEADVDG